MWFNPNFLSIATENLMKPLTNFGITCMSMGFLVDPDSAIVWRGLMVMQAIEKLLRRVAWGPLDYLVIDMPPGTGDTQLTISQHIPISGAVIVTTPQKIAMIDARKGVTMFKKVGVNILGIVQNMSYHQCGNCGTKHYLFNKDGAEQLAKDVQVDLLGDIPIDERIMQAADSGTPFVLNHADSPGAQTFREIAKKIVAKLPEPFPV